MPYTRLGLEGYGVRRAGSFAGKGGAHPVGIITRLGLDGYGVRRAGSFAGKTPAIGGHPVGILTRLALDGYGARRAGSFVGKMAAPIQPVEPIQPPVIPESVSVRPRRRFVDPDEELITIMAAVMPEVVKIIKH